MSREHDEAMVLLGVMTLGQQMGTMAATRELWADDFDPENPGTHAEAVNTVLYYGEILGTFVKSGALSKGLVTDMLWIDGLWGKVASQARRARAEAGVDALYENFELLASM
jgi:hypothetical protein